MAIKEILEQIATRRPTASKRPLLFFYIYLGANALDVISTWWFITLGVAAEGNPLILALFPIFGFWGTAVVKATVGLLVGFSLYTLRDYPVSRWTLYILTTAYTAFTIYQIVVFSNLGGMI